MTHVTLKTSFVAFALTVLSFVGVTAASVTAAESPGSHQEIEFARPGDVSLTLDAFVPDGDGPFPTCILVHGCV